MARTVMVERRGVIVWTIIPMWSCLDIVKIWIVVVWASCYNRSCCGKCCKWACES